MKTMRDSTTAGDAPNGADLYADYLDILASHDRRATVHICRDASVNAGTVLDTGEGVPDSAAPDWVLMRRAAGADPWVYTNEANWPVVRAYFRARRVTEPHWWIASYVADPNQRAATIVRLMAEGALAVQHSNPPITGGHYDESVVADDHPGLEGDHRMPDKTDYLGRGVVQALHLIATGAPISEADMNAVTARADDPANPGGWEFAIDDFVTGKIGSLGGSLHGGLVGPEGPEGPPGPQGPPGVPGRGATVTVDGTLTLVPPAASPSKLAGAATSEPAAQDPAPTLPMLDAAAMAEVQRRVDVARGETPA